MKLRQDDDKRQYTDCKHVFFLFSFFLNLYLAFFHYKDKISVEEKERFYV